MTTPTTTARSTGRRRRGGAPVNPRMRRLKNVAQFWQTRLDACGDDWAMAAAVAFDRARAVASRAERDGDPKALYNLAQMLTEWALRGEEAEDKRRYG
jgi:hypothetical protein